MNCIVPYLALGIALIPTIAVAIPYQGNNIYKVGNSALIVSTNPGNVVRFVFYDARTTKINRTANACGVASFILPNPLPASNYLVIDNQPYDMAATPTATLPACNTATGQLAEPRPNNFISNGRYYIVNKTPGSVVQIEYANHLKSTRTANSCGFVNLRGNSNFDLGIVGNFDIELNDQKQTLNFGDLPTVINDSSPLCRRVNGNYVPYIPMDW